MKQDNRKRILAWIGIILLVLLYLATLITAFLHIPGWDRLFQACLIATIGVPILMNEFDGAAVDRGVTQTTGLFEQQVVYVNPKEKTISRLYADGKLIGIVRDVNAARNIKKQGLAQLETEISA